VVGGVRTARAPVIVARRREVEPGLELEAVQTRDRRGVVGHRRGIRGARGEGPRLPGGPAAMLEEPQRGGAGASRRQQDDSDGDGDSDTESDSSHGTSLSHQGAG
jgi:hypothetical protein